MNKYLINFLVFHLAGTGRDSDLKIASKRGLMSNTQVFVISQFVAGSSITAYHQNVPRTFQFRLGSPDRWGLRSNDLRENR